MEQRHNIIAWVALTVLTGCHISPAAHVPNILDDEPPELLPVAPRANWSEQRVERPVRIPHDRYQPETYLRRAALRVVDGSECRVASAPLCGASGYCVGTVHVGGDVCVVLVRGESHDGQHVEPYCHDLSHPELSDPPRDDDDEHHPVWDECLEHAQKVVTMNRAANTHILQNI